MNSKNRLDRLRVASPCPANWEQMTGNERVRHCDLCSLNVYNIAEMTRREAEALIAKTEGRICGRLHRRSDGTVITKDCHVGLLAIRRRIARVAGAAFATLLSLCAAVAGQDPKKDKSCKQQVKITRKAEGSLAGDVAGVIQDEFGGVVPAAKISLLNRKTGKLYEIESKADGRFTTSNLPFGSYDMSVRITGFKDLNVKDLAFTARERVSLEVILIPDQETVTVGIIGYTPMIDTSQPGIKMVIDGDLIRKLPIP